MLDSIRELHLTDYFTAEAVLGDYAGDGRALFNALAHVYLLSAQSSASLYAEATSAEVRRIDSVPSYRRALRLQKYSRITGADASLPPEYAAIINIKGDALSVADEAGLVGANCSRGVICRNLAAAAGAGSIAALRVLGTLRCAGIFFERSEDGLSSLRKAAEWLDIPALAALLLYDAPSRPNTLARLKAACEGTPYAPFYGRALRCYGPAAEDDENARLLARAFSSGVVRRGVYEPKLARVLYSPALCAADKLRLVFSPSKELISAVCDLPVKLGGDREADFEVQAVRTPLGRAGEEGEVLRALSDCDLRRGQDYRPVCLVGDSQYVRNCYISAISRALSGANVVRLDPSAFTAYDIEPSGGNILVRSIREKQLNCFIFTLTGDPPEGALSAVYGFIKGRGRAQFHLGSPNVTLDLSDVLPVCVADPANAARAAEYCQVIELAPLSQKERPSALSDMAERARSACGLEAVELAKDALKLLSECDIDVAARAIERAVRSRRTKGGRLQLTAAQLAPLTAAPAAVGIGFGGRVK